MTWKRKPSKYDWKIKSPDLSLVRLFNIGPGVMPGNNSARLENFRSLPGTNKKRETRKRAKNSRRLNRGK